MRWHGDEHIARTRECLGEVRYRREARGKLRIGQVSRIAPDAAHRLDVRGVASPQTGGLTRAGALNGERRAPGAGADDRHRGGRLARRAPAR